MTDASNNGGLTAEKVKEALEALPNGVISKGQTDVTRVGSPAVTVSMQSAAGELTKVGGQEFMVEDYSGVLSGAGNFAYDGQALNGSPETTATPTSTSTSKSKTSSSSAQFP